MLHTDLNKKTFAYASNEELWNEYQRTGLQPQEHQQRMTSGHEHVEFPTPTKRTRGDTNFIVSKRRAPSSTVSVAPSPVELESGSTKASTVEFEDLMLYASSEGNPKSSPRTDLSAKHSMSSANLVVTSPNPSAEGSMLANTEYTSTSELILPISQPTLPSIPSQAGNQQTNRVVFQASVCPQNY